MIRQLFDSIRSAFGREREAPVKSNDRQVQARVKGAMLAAALTAPVERKSRRVKSGAGRLFRSYKPVKEV